MSEVEVVLAYEQNFLTTYGSKVLYLGKQDERYYSIVLLYLEST